MANLILWGAGGHGKVVLDIAQAMREFAPIFFIDDNCGEGAREFRGCQISGTGELRLQDQDPSRFLISIGNNNIRAACFARACAYGLLPVTLIHPSTMISDSARIEAGTVVMPRAVINADAQIGKNCIVNTAAVVEHDCRIGDHVHLSPGVLLGGGVTVHSFAHVGMGAVLLPGAEIGRGAIVGAGAVVLDSVPAGSTVVGVPARAPARARQHNQIHLNETHSPLGPSHERSRTSLRA